MDSKHWMRFIGLPYKLGADPITTEGADCVHLVFRVQALHGLPPPPIRRDWYRLLRRGDIGALRADYEALTRPIPEPRQLAMTLLPEDGFALGVFVDGGLLFIHQWARVTWVPQSVLLPLQYREFLHAV